jgi:hypothetical protein
MSEYILLMHNDVPDDRKIDDWEPYIAILRTGGHFGGGSAIGTGICATKSGATREITTHLSGYMRIQAQSFDDAQRSLKGNPVFEAGGTVEPRELPRTG